MPDSPPEDAFADLFGKLPDARARDAEESTDRAPMSRRAAREAARSPQPAGAAPQDDEPAWVVGAHPESVAVTPSPSPAPPPVPPAAPRPVTRAATGSSADAQVPARGGSPAGPRRSTASHDPTAPATSAARATAGSTTTAPAAGAPTLDDLFSTGTGPQAGTGAPKRRRRRIGGWIALGVVLVVLGGIAGGGLWVWNTYEAQIRAVMGWEEPKDYEDGLANGEALVTISTGDTGGVVSQSLFDAGVTKTPEAFYDMLVASAQNPTFYPGVYQLQKQMTSTAALAALQDPANKMENSALLREGLTVAQSLPILAESLGIPIEDFQAAVADPAAYGVTVDPAIVAAGGNPLEGWLFPAMYEFDPGVTATDVIAKMVNRTIQSLDAAGVPVEDRQRILTVASIIQREARYEVDMQKVSRVIENRLSTDNQDTFGKLQMDSTAQFGYGEMHDGTASSSQEALEDDNPWNTYVVTGLPIGPISNPGDAAIDAAMHPADGDWLYFVTVNLDTGETVFTSNIDDHNRAVEQWRAWCVDHPDSGC